MAFDVGVREIALYTVQTDEQSRPLKERDSDNNLKKYRFVLSEDIDQDSLPDDYERKRGLSVGADDSLLDIDGDGVNNIEEYLGGLDPLSLAPDSDSDGVPDDTDAFPNDPLEWLDTDGDLIGDNSDDDDDNDGFSDEQEAIDGTNPLSRFSCRSGCFSFDIDENREARHYPDGLLVIRHLFGFQVIHW